MPPTRPRHRAWIAISAALLILLQTTPTHTEPHNSNDQDVGVLPAEGKDTNAAPIDNPKLGSIIRGILSRQQENAVSSTTGEASPASVASPGTLHVTVHHDHRQLLLLAWLNTRGIVPSMVGPDFLEAHIATNLLPTLAAEQFVTAIRKIIPPSPDHINLVDFRSSQGVTVHKATTWHRAGYLGEGVKVGVIDTGFKYYQILQARGEVPKPAGMYCFPPTDPDSTTQNCEEGAHGTAVAEAIIDMAPNASLYLSDPRTPGDLLNAVNWMIQQDVDIINHSVSWNPDGPGDGRSFYSDSPLRSVSKAAQAGILWVNSAGNDAGNVWHGAFNAGTGDNINTHNFSTATNPVYRNSLTIGDAPEVLLYMRWEDDWPDLGCDMRLQLYRTASDGNNQSITDKVAEGFAWQSEVDGQISRYPITAVKYPHPEDDGGRYAFQIVRDAACTDPPTWIQVLAWYNAVPTYQSTSHHITNPAESAEAGMLAVGAAPYYATSTLEPFSNRGPTLDGRIKPDLVGADCAFSSVYNPLPRGSNTCWFPGTSQSSPYVAGMAALVVDRFKGNANFDTPTEIATYLKNGAVQQADPDDLPDPNSEWGHGLAALEELTIVDYDIDNDGLIEVASLAQLDAVRYDLNGDGVVASADQTSYDAAFPNAKSAMGCPTTGCEGYELHGDLDFDSNDDDTVNETDHSGSFWNSGAGWAAIGDQYTTGTATPARYTGIFEGNGHVIEHMTMDLGKGTAPPSGATHRDVGLFAGIGSDGTIRNLGLANVNIRRTASTTNPATVPVLRVGALAGVNEGTTNANFSTGSVAVSGTDVRAGGLLGANGLAPSGNNSSAAVLSNSYSTVSLAVTADKVRLGGVAAVNHGRVENGYSMGSVAGTVTTGGTDDQVQRSYTLGGLVAENAAKATVKHSYAATKMSLTGTAANPALGGLVGANAGTVTDGYWDRDQSGQAQSAGSLASFGKTTTEMTTPTDVIVEADQYSGIYASWDSDRWGFSMACHYPALEVDVDGNGAATSEEFGAQALNCVPQVLNTISAKQFNTGTNTTVPLETAGAHVFTDEDLDDLTYTVNSSKPEVVKAGLDRDGTSITLEAVSPGASQIEVRASDTHASVGTSFTVTVPNRSPTASGVVNDLTLDPGNSSQVTIESETEALFTDPDGEALTYTVASSNEAAATATIGTEGKTAQVTGVAQGTSDVTITASGSWFFNRHHHLHSDGHQRCACCEKRHFGPGRETGQQHSRRPRGRRIRSVLRP